MSQTSKVKAKLETVAKAKVQGATAAEAANVILEWAEITNNLEASQDLRAEGTLLRRELELHNGETVGRERALAQLDALAAAYLP